MTITEQDIVQFAGNASAAQTGRGEAGSFISLEKDGDESIMWGRIAGSSGETYLVSVDFTDKEKPVGRCTCASRKRPCKHTIGLLWAKAQDFGFVTAPLPDSLAEAREKDKAKLEKAAKPVVITKAKAASEAKKAASQLEGLELGEKILRNIGIAGFTMLTETARAGFEAQIKELGNYYIPGVQAGFKELIDLIKSGQADEEKDFSTAVDQCGYLSSLLKKARSYLEKKKADFEAFPAMTETSKAECAGSPIEEQLGYGWKLPELKDKGLARNDAELLQAALWTVKDNVRNQWVDTALWLSLADKQLYRTENFRIMKQSNPKEPEEPFFKILSTSELYIYPGEMNQRIRWEKQSWREPAVSDYQNAQKAGLEGFADIVKAVKNLIKSPLASAAPYYPLKVAGLRGNGGDLAVYDSAGTGIALNTAGTSFGWMMDQLSREQIEGQTLIVRFDLQRAEDEDGEDRLTAAPIALFTGEDAFRFV